MIPKPWIASQSTTGQTNGAPVLLTCEHASYHWPESSPCFPENCWLQEHYGWDPGAALLQKALARQLGAPTVRSNFSRLYIDPNRDLDSPSLIRHHIMGKPLPFNTDLSEDQRQKRLQAHSHYHTTLANSCRQFQQTREHFLILGVHSFTPMLGRFDRTHIDIGLLHDAPNQGIAETLRDKIQSFGLNCYLNEPYSGQNGLCYAVARHGQEFSVPYLLLEVRSDLLQQCPVKSPVGRALLDALRGTVEDLSWS